MRLRWKLFLSHFLATAVVVFGVVLLVRGITLQSVSAHMESMMRNVAGGQHDDLRATIARDLTVAILWGLFAAVVVAGLASYLVSGLFTDTIGRLARAAERVAAGHYDERVNYPGHDEIGDLAQSFNEMAEKLEATESLRRELLGTISHELRTPLTNIQGYMEGLLDGVVPEEPETYQLVHQEAGRLVRLVADIERLSRVEAGAEPVTPRRLATRPLLAGAADRLRPRFEEKPLVLEVVVPDAVPDVWADEDKVIQVLTNLLGNAFAYTPAGGRVEVTAEPRGPAVLVGVRDDGIGIPAEDLPHIFERFYRVDKSRATASGGTGVGLAVARSLVEQMGGRIWAESQPGQGTVVSFLLPVAGGQDTVSA